MASVRDSILIAITISKGEAPSEEEGAYSINQQIKLASDKGAPKPVPPGGQIPEITPKEFIESLRWEMRRTMNMAKTSEEKYWAKHLCRDYLRSIQALQNGK